MSDRLYTTNQLAKLFGVVPTTVIGWVEAGRLRAFRTLGGHRRITHRAVLAFLQENGLDAPPALAEPEPAIVLLDRDPDVLELLAGIVRRAVPGTAVLCADQPVDALVTVGRVAPAVVAFDVDMTSMDPLILCAGLRRACGPGLTIVAVSNEFSDGLAASFLEHGADHFLPKTVAVQRLGELCAEILSRGSSA